MGHYIFYDDMMTLRILINCLLHLSEFSFLFYFCYHASDMKLFSAFDHHLMIMKITNTKENLLLM